jgi:hypothetical protein
LNLQDLDTLLQSTLSNPTLSGANFPVVLTAQAQYLINLAPDYDKAAQVMEKAADVSGELEYRVSLLRFLVALQRKAEAQQQLDKLRQLDKHQLYGEEIDRQTAAIASISTEQKH